MKLKILKLTLGHWLSINELKGFLLEMPDEVFQRIPVNRKLLEFASEFVEERRGWWEHPDWEFFLDKLDNEGFSPLVDVHVPIGNILEIFKSYYHSGNFHKIVNARKKTYSVNRSAAQKTRSAKRFETEKHA